MITFIIWFVVLFLTLKVVDNLSGFSKTEAFTIKQVIIAFISSLALTIFSNILLMLIVNILANAIILYIVLKNFYPIGNETPVKNWLKKMKEKNIS